MKSAHRIGTNHGGAIIGDEKENRLAALRQRVRSKLVESRIASKKRQRKADNEIVVQVSQSKEGGGLLLLDDEISDGEKEAKNSLYLSYDWCIDGYCFRCINPSRKSIRVTKFVYFQTTDSLDIHGLVLDEEGEAVANVSIELVDPETKSTIKALLLTNLEDML